MIFKEYKTTGRRRWIYGIKNGIRKTYVCNPETKYKWMPLQMSWDGDFEPLKPYFVRDLAPEEIFLKLL